MSQDPAACPVLDAYDTGRNFVQSGAQFCRHWHLHGRSAGHRVAHCDVDASPYERTGYVLKDAGPAPPWVRHDLTRRQAPTAAPTRRA